MMDNEILCKSTYCSVIKCLHKCHLLAFSFGKFAFIFKFLFITLGWKHNAYYFNVCQTIIYKHLANRPLFYVFHTKTDWIYNCTYPATNDLYNILIKSAWHWHKWKVSSKRCMYFVLFLLGLLIVDLLDRLI